MNIQHLSGSGRAWVLMRAGQTQSANSSGRDVDAARRLHESLGAPVFYFRLGDRAWVVDDARLIADIERTLEPMLGVATRQKDTGLKQADVGHQQGAIGTRMAGAGIEMGLGHLGDGLAGLTSLQAEMKALTEEQKALARQQHELEEEQREATGRAHAAIDKLMEDAIVAGTARDLSEDSPAS